MSIQSMHLAQVLIGRTTRILIITGRVLSDAELLAIGSPPPAKP